MEPVLGVEISFKPVNTQYTPLCTNGVSNIFNKKWDERDTFIELFN